MMNTSIKAAVAGLGRIGWRHASDICKTEGLGLSALCEPNAELAEKAKTEFKVPVYQSYEKMLEESEADFVVIATPSHMHFEMASKALEKGFNVMVEKPISPSAEEAKKLKSLAEKAKRWISVNQSFRYRPDVAYIKDIIKSGLIGEIFQIHIYAPGGFTERTDWQIWRKFDGGALSNWGVHLVDAILFITEQEPVDVFAKLDRILDKGDAEDSFKVIVKMDNGCTGEAEAAKSFFNKTHWHICGTKGSIIGEFDPLPVMKIRVQYVADGKPETKTESFDFSQQQYTSQLLPHYAALVKNLNNGNIPPVTIDSVIRTMSVLDAARESSAKGQSVRII
ncbi:MAG: hypothetical protein A2020_10495 [Lentisphaerae bacterium GWF2_45_14]|nr:MAG: hypothetical protein A2020_10495 [Lentisphaerae bacterium GWF2_45_14]